MNKRLSMVCLILEQVQQAEADLEALDCDVLDDQEGLDDLDLIETRLETASMLISELISKIRVFNAEYGPTRQVTK